MRDTSGLAMLKAGRFHPFKREQIFGLVWNGAGRGLSSGPVIFPCCCPPPLPIINDWSIKGASEWFILHLIQNMSPVS